MRDFQHTVTAHRVGIGLPGVHYSEPSGHSFHAREAGVIPDPFLPGFETEVLGPVDDDSLPFMVYRAVVIVRGGGWPFARIANMKRKRR